jgi:hypothetical protein
VDWRVRNAELSLPERKKRNSAICPGNYDMLFGHYRTLMTKEEAEKIFALTPDVVLKAT